MGKLSRVLYLFQVSSKWYFHILTPTLNLCTFMFFYQIYLLIFTFPLRLLQLRICQFSIIQLMHSFEVNIGICQPEKNDVLFTKRSRREHHFRGLTKPDVNRKRVHQLFCNMALSLFSKFYIKSFIFINLIKPDVLSAHKKIFSQLLLVRQYSGEF